LIYTTRCYFLLRKMVNISVRVSQLEFNLEGIYEMFNRMSL
jgi:hypothetical protein